MTIAAAEFVDIPVLATLGDNLFNLAPTPYIEQQQTNWCWAACFEMVRAHLGMQPMSQCELYKAVFGRDCCFFLKGQASRECNAPAFPEAAAKPCGLRCVKYPNDFHGENLSFSEIRESVNKGFLVECLIARDTGNHVILVVGTQDPHFLRIHDPWAAVGPATIVFDDLKNSYREGRWVASYAGLAPRL